MKKNQKAGCAFLGGGCLVIFCIGGGILLVLAIGISNMESPQNANPQPATAEKSDYTWKEDHSIPGIKRSLVVFLDGKVSEERLREIALELKSKETRSYERTFIVYLLPGMKENEGAWATTHFDPDLKIDILDFMAPPDQN
ncbi:hypothetical protein [Gimesia algae]|uniref:Uncharacterized protein n=1 Tax=Gimesia algae TaxID=2527971 RepID=A0A517VML2_9PLAN|nr:hypothetical protein [Gimesia algae]QDT94253.1 hypothetical protein Pan161_59480 [Gimesia algae]